MKATRLSKRMIVALPILLAAAVGPASAQAADPPPAMGAPRSDTTTESDMAAGSVEDTLQACMARIPKDASIGQRMIAEQSCGRDESDRKPVQAIPGARTIGHQQP